MALPLIHMKGDPYKRGIAYGTCAQEQIKMVIDEYKYLFEKKAHLSWEIAQEKAMSFSEVVQRYCPDQILEMEGIAKGAEVAYSEIFAINCRTEMIFSKNTEACTAIVIPPESSENGKTYLSQNWDSWTIGKGSNVILEIEQKPLPNALIVTEAGIIGGKGINSEGLALSQNALSVNHYKNGLPLQFILRGTIAQTSVPKAIDFIASIPRASAACVGLATPDGTVAMVEYAPNNMDVLLSDGNPLCHTNHWISPIMLSDPETSRYTVKSTFTRLDWARRLTKSKIGTLRKKDLFRILGNHAGYPDSICRHGDCELSIHERFGTLWSMVVDTSEKVIWLTDGNPCSEKPVGYQLLI